MFVYGTLRPGAEAWSLLAPYATAWADDTLEGELYDTGLGYPALVVSTGDVPAGTGGDGPLIDGAIVELAGHLIAQALTALDRYEDVPEGLYVRRRLPLGSGRRAWVYVWNRPVDGMARVRGRWSGPPGAPAPLPPNP